MGKQEKQIFQHFFDDATFGVFSTLHARIPKYTCKYIHVYVCFLGSFRQLWATCFPAYPNVGFSVFCSCVVLLAFCDHVTSPHTKHVENLTQKVSKQNTLPHEPVLCIYAYIYLYIYIYTHGHPSMTHTGPQITARRDGHELV